MSTKTARLGDVCDINPRAPKSIKDERVVSFLPMASVSEDGTLIDEQEREVSEVRKGYSFFERGDIILAKITPCFENGKAARTSSLKHSIGFGSTEFHVLRASKEVLPDYIFYAVWNSSFREIGTRNMTGSAGQKRIPTDFVSRLEIPLPPLDEQRRIAAVLDKADVLRRKRKRALNLLSELRDEIYAARFVHRLQDQWPKVTVGELALNLRTGPFGSQLLHSEFVPSGIPVLGIDNVVSNEFTWRQRRYISDEKFEQLRRYVVCPGDVLVTIMGTCGRCAVVPTDIPTAINTKHLCCITLDKTRCLPDFLHATLLGHPNVLKQLGIQAKGAVMPGLNMGIIRSISLNLPPLEEQIEFLRDLTAIKQIIKTARIGSDKAHCTFESLQHHAFVGDF